MKKTIEWVCGNIAVKAEMELPDGIPPFITRMAGEGLTQVLQRKPSSAWEKAAAGYEKRPEGFKRNSIAYSDASAKELVGFFTAALDVDKESREAGVAITFATSEHVAGESDTKPSKEAETLWTDVQAYPADRFAKAMTQLGLDAEDYDDERAVKACHAYLVEAKRAAAAKAKSGIGS